MPDRMYAISVGTSATPLPGTEFPGFRILNNGADPVFLGDSNVATTTGYPLASGEEFIPQEIAHHSLSGRVEDRLYGIVTASTIDVRVLVDAKVSI